MTDSFLEARSIRKSYGRTPALDGISLVVEKGELFGLLGPNGAGKTTLLSILAGLLDADGGEVLLDGQPFSRRDTSRRHRVGLGTQDLAVYPELTARENLLFFGRLYGMNETTLQYRVDELLNAVGLSDRAQHRTGTFSGGMKRRLNLAVAVVHQPDVLFLDEPTTGVDPQSRNHIFELVKSLNAAGMTIIYTSHYMEEVQALCKRIAIIDHGEVKACDTVENLLKLLNAHIQMMGITEIEEFRTIPGVSRITPITGGIDLTAESAASVLPRLAEVWMKHGTRPHTLHVSEPSLERVFLHLTGHALRD